MKFLNPNALWLLLGVPLLILVYILKTQHEERRISSTFIWKRSERLIKKKMPWQILRRSILFILQLLSVVLIAFIAARPTMQVKGKGEEWILIMDGSASMKTATDGSTRFERAVKEAEDLIADMGYGNKATVIYTGDRTAYSINRSDSLSQVTATLESLVPSDYAGDFDTALNLARLIQQENPYAKIYYFSDKNYTDTSDVNVVNVALENEWNVAVKSLSATEDSGTTVFMATVVSYGRDATVTTALLVNGNVVSAKAVDCKKDEPQNVYFTAADMNTPVKFGSFSTAEVFVEAEDGNTSDNSFYLCETVQKKKSVMLVSSQPVFLQSLLTAFDGYGVKTFETLEAAIGSLVDHDDPEAAIPTTVSGYDLYVFDGVLPETMPTDGVSWIFNVKDLPASFSLPLSTEADTLKTTDEDGNEIDTGLVAGNYLAFGADTGTAAFPTMTQFYDAAHIAVKSLYPYANDGSWQEILTCGEWPAVLIPANYDSRMVVFAFDIHNSNLPLLVDYPELFGDMAEFSWPVQLSDADFELGDVVTVTRLPKAESVTLTHPNGESFVLLPVDAPRAFTVNEPGLYVLTQKVREGGSPKEKKFSFYVHTSAGESDTGFEGGALYTLDDIGAPDVGEGNGAVEIWLYLAIALLIVMMTEWWVYYREQY